MGVNSSEYRDRIAALEKENAELRARLGEEPPAPAIEEELQPKAARTADAESVMPFMRDPEETHPAP